jgi:AbrB family looped-hinge helix DNA binding protein
VAQPVRLGPQGRIVVPMASRRALGWQPGEFLVAWVEGDRLVLRPRDSVEEELWAHCAAPAAGLADELIEDLRHEASRDGA